MGTAPVVYRDHAPGHFIRKEADEGVVGATKAVASVRLCLVSVLTTCGGRQGAARWGSTIKARLANLAQGFHDTTMLLSLAVWLCALPIVLLLTMPFFGWQVGVGAAVITLLAAVAACWGICFFPKISVEEFHK